MSHRKTEYLNEKQIIYRRDVINNMPTISTETYDYYKDGTNEYYNLFNTKSKITTYRSLKWHMLVLYYLNDNISNKNLEYIFKFIANKENGFVTFFIKEKLLNSMIKDVMRQGGDAPVNKTRKIIFIDFCPLSFDEKMKIIGKLIGRIKKVYAEDIYQCMLDLNEFQRIITWDRVAMILNCSVRTIHRNLTKELRKEKEILNEKI